jgi:hypothetical protein
MDKLAKQCDQLEQELRELEAKEEALQALIDILTPVDFEIITHAYRSCLSAGRPRSVPETLLSLLRQLAEIPGEPGELKPLCSFVNLLIQNPFLATEPQMALRDWAQSHPLAAAISTLPPVLAQLETGETCLMIKVQPRSLNDPSLGYLLSAAIADDPDPLNPEATLQNVKSLTLAEGTDPKCAPGYSKEALPDVLNRLIALCTTEHPIALTDLTVHWFLPIELMSLPIEHWQIRIGRSQQPSNGQRCQGVIVRSYDRHFLTEYYQIASGDWKKYWQRLLTLESCCHNTLDPLDPIAGQTQINLDNPEIVGCRFMEHPDSQKQIDFWDNLLGQGLPIALWARHLETNQPTAAEIMQAVADCVITKLPSSLTRHRHQHLSIEPLSERLMAAPLSLLWDNPFRPFPPIEYQS